MISLSFLKRFDGAKALATPAAPCEKVVSTATCHLCKSSQSEENIGFFGGLQIGVV